MEVSKQFWPIKLFSLFDFGELSTHALTREYGVLHLLAIGLMHKATWRVVGWRHMVERSLKPACDPVMKNNIGILGDLGIEPRSQ